MIYLGACNVMFKNVVCLLLLLEMPHWCDPWKTFPAAVSSTLPLYGCNRAAGPQHCLLHDIRHVQQNFHPKVSLLAVFSNNFVRVTFRKVWIIQTVTCFIIYGCIRYFSVNTCCYSRIYWGDSHVSQDSSLSELKADRPHQTDNGEGVANFTVELERRMHAWGLPQLRTTQNDVTTWQNATPAHYESSPLQCVYTHQHSFICLSPADSSNSFRRNWWVITQCRHIWKIWLFFFSKFEKRSSIFFHNKSHYRRDSLQRWVENA